MHDHDPIDFEMTDLATRPGPCRKATAEETDATAARLAGEVEAAPFIAEATGLANRPTNEEVQAMPCAPLDRHFRWDVRRRCYWDVREFGGLTEREEFLMSAVRGGGKGGLMVEPRDEYAMDCLAERGHVVKCYDGRYRLPAVEVRYGSGKVKV